MLPDPVGKVLPSCREKYWNCSCNNNIPHYFFFLSLFQKITVCPTPTIKNYTIFADSGCLQEKLNLLSKSQKINYFCVEFVNCLPFRKVRLASSLYVDFTVVHSETFPPPPRQQGSFWESQELNLGLFFNYCRSRCVWWSQPLTGSWTWVSFLCRSRCVCWSLPLTGSGSTTARWSAPPAPPSAQTAPRRAGSSRWANTNNLLTQALKRSAPPAPPSAQTAPRKAGSSRWANTNNLLTQALKRSAPPAPPSAQTMLQGRPGAQGEQTK